MPLPPHAGPLRQRPACPASRACLLVVLMIGVGAAGAASGTEADLAARLKPLGLRVTQYTLSAEALRVSFEDEHGYDQMLALGLVLKAAASQAPPDGFVEAVAMAGDQTLLQLRTSAAGVDQCLKQSLSRKQFVQVQQVLNGATVPPGPAVSPAPATAPKSPAASAAAAPAAAGASSPVPTGPSASPTSASPPQRCQPRRRPDCARPRERARRLAAQRRPQSAV